MEVLMDVTINWMAHLNPEYTNNIVSTIQSEPDRIKTVKLKLQKESERDCTYVDITGMELDWSVFKKAQG